MTRTRPLAVGVTPMETRPDVILELALHAERCGYSAFSVAEGWGHDASVLLAEIALRTTRIQLGTGVLNVWGRSAATIAMLATSLAGMSDGRFVLGLGAGSPQLAEGLHNVPFAAPVDRLAAVTREVRRLLDGEQREPSETGRTRPLQLAVRPEHPVPIQLAALGPRAVRLSGELADSWCPFLLPISGLAGSVRLLAEGAARVPGRAIPRICPAVPAAVSADPDRAAALASWWIAFYLTRMGPLYRNTLRRAGFGPEADLVVAGGPPRGGTARLPVGAEVLVDELTVHGDAGEARAGLDRWYRAGAEMPAIVLPPNQPVGDLLHTIESLRPG
jgi:alkanesulfonate monooxygenase SsuD/methylene tetrahydromethanopterin reductase-like flavin-dependent oxidoreductase (luciferase family)